MRVGLFDDIKAAASEAVDTATDVVTGEDERDPSRDDVTVTDTIEAGPQDDPEDVAREADKKAKQAEQEDTTVTDTIVAEQGADPSDVAEAADREAREADREQRRGQDTGQEATVVRSSGEIEETGSAQNVEPQQDGSVEVQQETAQQQDTGGERRSSGDRTQGNRGRSPDRRFGTIDRLQDRGGLDAVRERAEQVQAARQRAESARATAEAASERADELRESDRETVPVDVSKLTDEGRQELGIEEDAEGTVTVTKEEAVEFLEKQEEAARKRADAIVAGLFEDDSDDQESPVQQELDRIENRGPLDFEDQDLRGQFEDVLDAGSDVVSEVRKALLEEDSDVSGSIKQFFEETSEAGSQLLVEGSFIGQKVEESAKEKPERGVFVGGPGGEDTVLPDAVEDEIHRLEAKAAGGVATAGSQGAGFVIGGVGGLGREATEAAEQVGGGDFEAAKEKYFELGESGREFIQATAQQASEDPAGFVTEELAEEIPETLIGLFAAGPVGALTGAVPTPEPTPAEPEPEPEPEAGTGAGTGMDPEIEVQQGAPPQLVQTQEPDPTATPGEAEPEADRVGELFGVRGDETTEFATEQDALTAVVRDPESGEVEDVFFGSVSSRGEIEEGGAEGMAEVSVVRVGDDSGVIDVGDLEQTLVDFEIEAEQVAREPVFMQVEGQGGMERVLTEFEGRIGEQEIQGRSKELRIFQEELGEKGFSESAAVDPDDDFIVGFREFQSAVSSGQRTEGATRSTILEQDALEALDVDEITPEGDEGVSFDDLSAEDVGELQATAEDIFGSPDDAGAAPEAEPERRGGDGPDADQLFGETEPEPEQEPDVSGPVQEAEREAFRQVVESEVEAEPEAEPEPDVEPDVAITTFEQLDDMEDPFQDEGQDQQPDLGQLVGQEIEPDTEEEPQLVQEQEQEPVTEGFPQQLDPQLEPEPEVLDADFEDVESAAGPAVDTGEAEEEYKSSIIAETFGIEAQEDEGIVAATDIRGIREENGGEPADSEEFVREFL